MKSADNLFDKYRWDGDTDFHGFGLHLGNVGLLVSAIHCYQISLSFSGGFDYRPAAEYRECR